MTRDEAVAQVASHAAAFLTAGDFEESTGLSEELVSEADQDRLMEAVEIVILRLYRMGKGGRS